MPYVNNHGVQVYYEVEGQGPPIILAHGAAGDISYWRGYGYVDPLIDDYRVILFDARGHGKSDKPGTVEAYLPEKMVEDALLILDTLKIDATAYQKTANQLIGVRSLDTTISRNGNRISHFPRGCAIGKCNVLLKLPSSLCVFFICF